MPSKEEAYILKGYEIQRKSTQGRCLLTSSFCSPDENNVLPYLKTMGRLKDGVDTIEKSQLRSCDKTIHHMVIYIA